jgi:RimJ/RimL family protein N-acetyltransferase
MQKYLLGEEFHLGIILDNELIGLCGLASIDSANKKAELGYWIGKNYWGNGYGKEAVRLMAHFCFSELKLNKIYAKVLTNNERSIKLLGKLGFCNEGKSREDIYHMGSFLDDYTFSLLKIDYKDRENFLVEQ